MYRISTKISKEKFERMLSGRKTYLSRDARRALKEGGKSRLLNRKSVRKDEALAAVKLLMEKGLLSGYKSASKLYQKAGKEQWEEEKKEKEEKEKEEKEEEKETKKAKKEGALAAEKKKHIRYNIARDITRELMAEERENDPLRHRLENIRGKRIGDEIQEEQEQREKTAAEEKEKSKELYNPLNPQGPNRQTSKPIDINKLPDMDIDGTD